MRDPVRDQAEHGKYATGKRSHNMQSKLRISTWNVWKLKELGQLQTFCKKISRTNIQILGIVKTNWNSNGSLMSGNSCSHLFGKWRRIQSWRSCCFGKRDCQLSDQYYLVLDTSRTIQSHECCKWWRTREILDTQDAIPKRNIKIVMGIWKQNWGQLPPLQQRM